ncbi:MAG: hypothetical protein GY931_19795 [Maribacter sp.]|nr:hypothetical protein [Maribacter sp.]
MEEIAKASVLYWAKRAKKHGSFEEYYPWENGYPPLAFSTLAAAKLIERLNISSKDVSQSLKIAAKQLLNRFEHQAANQQVAGLAALAVIKKIIPNLVSDEDFEKISQKTLDLQNPDGWFSEYDGPDLGYLSVTMDCLWDLYDYTGDQKFYQANVKVLNFIAPFVDFAKSNIGMHNARNTDYIVPYGIARFLNEPDSEVQVKASIIFQTLFGKINEHHFFMAVDDRYWIHYIGHSVARAELFFKQHSIKFDKSVNAKSDQIKEKLLLENSGHLILKYKNYQLLLSLNKGGIITIKNKDSEYSNYGWILIDNNTQHVTHWWHQGWKWNTDDRIINISGHMVPHTEKESVPLKHILLRIMSYLFGNKIIATLKKQLIFKEKRSQFIFKRIIELKNNEIIINDSISGVNELRQVKKAPRSSKRHVASADSFHKEDFELNNGFTITEENQIKDGVFESEIVIAC